MTPPTNPNALLFSSRNPRHRRACADRRDPAPGRKGQWTRREFRRRELFARRIHWNSSGWQSPHQGNVVVCGYFPRAIVRAPGDVDSHSGSQVGSRGYFRKPSAGDRTGSCGAVNDSTCSPSRTRAGRHQSQRGRTVYGYATDDSSRNEAVAKS